VGARSIEALDSAVSASTPVEVFVWGAPQEVDWHKTWSGAHA
jgi:hypothetical protein